MCPADALLLASGTSTRKLSDLWFLESVTLRLYIVLAMDPPFYTTRGVRQGCWAFPMLSHLSLSGVKQRVVTKLLSRLGMAALVLWCPTFTTLNCLPLS